jgi:adenosylcobyric acid synthase
MAAIMIQGCGSDVGKSVIVAGLCRLFTNRGLNVRPFKPQNMSNNAAVTADGGEIGRAQALQAMACHTPATVDMNPVLLKPQSDTGAQIIVRGYVAGTWQARAYQERKADMLGVVLDSFRRLQSESDLMIVEGAGSPAEINLRRGDIANMGFARAADVPVVLVGDIDRGHVIAALAGAHSVLEPEDRAMIRGFIVNKFRGDASLFDDGRREIMRRTGWRDLGMIPWLAAMRKLPAEDAVVLDEASRHGGGKVVKVVVPMLSRLANFDDFDPLQNEPDVAFTYIKPGSPLPGDADLVILPGTKATLADLAFFRAQGWDIDLAAHIRRGGAVLGICGGFQMLGRAIADPQGIEGATGSAPGLGFLDIETVFLGEKILRPVTGRLNESNARFEGYEMHIGRTTGGGLNHPLLHIDGRADGAVSPDGRVMGTYVHGLFASGEARAALLGKFGAASHRRDHGVLVDALLDDVARELERALDIDALAAIAKV